MDKMFALREILTHNKTTKAPVMGAFVVIEIIGV